MKHSWLFLGAGVMAAGMLGAWLGPALADKPEPYNPTIDPANFVGVINNQYLPLTPGRTFTYEAETEDGLARDVMRVTHETKVILGVTCTVVRDTALLIDEVTPNGRVEEDTQDWFAQDRDGNVWYFGEFTTSYEYDEQGNQIGTSNEGSWEAGQGDPAAQPGIVMLAHPRSGDSYRQEFAEGEAEDMAAVLRLNASVSVPYDDFDDCLETKEWTPLEPGHVEQKFYAPGVGLVLVLEHHGKIVRQELVDITTE
jgi:hypothetical protein